MQTEINNVVGIIIHECLTWNEHIAQMTKGII